MNHFSKSLVILCLLLAGFLNMAMAQSPERANRLFESGNYKEALQQYQILLRRSPRNLLYAYRTARCLQENGQWEEALPLFAKTGKKYVLTYFFMGECYQALWRSEEAIEAFNTYLIEATNHNRDAYIHEQISLAEKRQRYMRRVADVQVIDSVRMTRTDLLTAYPLSQECGRLEHFLNDSTIAYRNQRGDQRYFSVNENGQQRLFRQNRLLDDWAQAEPLPETINQGTAQAYPFVLSDGVTLYFASQSEDGLGGWDIYMSRYNSVTNTYMTAENIGYPFNSEGNDYLYAVDELRGMGYFASDRYCSADSVTVYRFVLSDPMVFLPRDMAHDSVVAYARLQTFHKGEEPVYQAAVQPVEASVTAEPAWQFVLSDGVVYTSLSDFRTEAGLSLFEQYQALLLELQQKETELADLRAAYRKASPTERKTMTETILAAERTQEQLQARCKQLENQIRQAELTTNKRIA